MSLNISEKADPVLLEKQLKVKWMNEYISEINNKSSRRQFEVSNFTILTSNNFFKKEKELQLEKEHNECLIKEALQQRERNLKYKFEVSNKLSQEYKKEEEEKRMRKLKEDEEYKRKQNTSLDHKYDQHVHNFRSKVSSLSDRVDSNAQNYLKYRNTQKDDYYKKIEDFQDKCFNSIKLSQDTYGRHTNSNSNYNMNLNGHPTLNASLDQYIKENQLNVNNGENNLAFDKYDNIKIEDIENQKFQNYYNSNDLNEFSQGMYNVEGFNSEGKYHNDNYTLDNKINHKDTQLLENSNHNNFNGVNSQLNHSDYIRILPENQLNFNSSIKKPESNDLTLGSNNFNYQSLDKIRQHSPSYKQFYSFNPQKEYNLKDTTTSLRNNIIAHNNSHRLDEVFKQSKQNYTAISKSILDFNKEQVKYKDIAKALEDENKRKLIEERLKESQKIKLENIESNVMRHQKQVNYKSILDHQMIPNFGCKTDQDQFKFYVTPKNYFLGGTQLDHNPIINPVNNYNFARYYLQRNHMNQSMK